jgi:hypothetical protein
LAQTPPAGEEQKRRLIEQKLKLVDGLVNSPAANTAAYGRDAETPQLLERGKQALGQARQALAENRLEDASKLLDEALKATAAASRRLSASASLSESAQRKNLQDLSDQLAGYRGGLVDLTKDAKVGGEAKALLARIDGLADESRKLAASGQLGDANRKLAEAYKLAVEEIAKLRAGQEVVMSLKFDTPAEEYAYEQKHFNSNEILVDMMIGQGRADGERRKMVDGFVAEGRKLKADAEGRANAGAHKEAVGLMEKAVGQLNRALQTMGVPVF